MIVLPVSLPNRRLDFAETGDVLDHASGQTIGSWGAESSNPAEQNSLIFRDNAGGRQVLRARYAFNGDNQLVVALDPADGAVTTASTATFNGSIAIDDEHDVIYTLASAPATDLAQEVVLYGDLSFDGPSRLVLQLSSGGQTVITSAEAAPFTTGQNTDVTLAGQDLLTYHAVTTNHFGDQTDVRPASIMLAGQWKLWPQGLSFECSASGDLTKPDLVLSLKGRCKAVAAGLEFRLDDGAPQALLTVEGQNTFDAATATWSVAVGYSQLAEPAKRIQAKAQGQLSYTTKQGNQLTIAGALSYSGDGQTAGSLDLSLDAQYTFAGGRIVFKATASRGAAQVQYDLQLGGQIKVRDGTLVFDVQYSSTGTLSIAVNYAGSDADFLKNFNVKITRDATGKVTVGLNFAIKVTYINGVQVVAKAA